MSHKPTDEQQAVVDGFIAGRNLVVKALAGSGKTTLLNMAANAAPARRGLYIAFGKDLVKEARGKFKINVDCRTAHSLAMADCGRQFAHRLNAPRMPARDIARIMYADGRHPDTRILNSPVQIGDARFTQGQIARLSIDTVDRFCQSADVEINAHHVPKVNGLEGQTSRAELASVVVPIARLAWKDLSHPAGKLKYQPDYYLKTWALSSPKLLVDYILFDEAQDTNPVLAEVLTAQTHTQQVAVGDEFQQLYAWRGAVDALATWPADDLLYLSKSWRFGPAVAERANQFLRLLGATTLVRGNDAIASEVRAIEAPDAVLCRSNAGAMARVMEHVDAGRRVHLVGGGMEMKRLAQAAERLQRGEPVEHPDLIAFSSWNEVRMYAAEEDDGDMAMLVKLVDEYGPKRLGAVVDSLASEADAEVTVSTGHKSKGRQWPAVKVAPDFKAPSPRPYPDRESPHYAVVLDRAELMLLYVAVTRAELVLDDSALSWVDTIHDFGLPVIVRGPGRKATAVPRHREVIDLPPFRDPAPEFDAALALSAELTGIPEEQADWEADLPTPRHEGECKGLCDDAFPRRCLWPAPQPIGATA